MSSRLVPTLPRLAAPIAVLMVAAVLLQPTLASAANPQIGVFVRGGIPGDQVQREQAEPNALPGQIVSADIDHLAMPRPGTSGNVLAAGGARLGSLGSFSFARAVANSASGGVGTFSATSNAFWEDLVTIDAAGLAGQRGVFRASVLLDGLLSTTYSLQDRAQAQVTIGLRGNPSAGSSFATFAALPGSGWQEGSLTRVSATLTLDRANALQEFNDAVASFDVRFTFGVPFTFGVALGTRATFTPFGGTGLDVIGSADFANTLNWNGIDNVHLAGSNTPVAGWTVVTQSGFDLASPVPELPSVALLALGLLGVGAWRRHSLAASLVRSRRPGSRHRQVGAV